MLKKLILTLFIVITTGNALSLTDEYIEQIDKCKGGDTELCIQLGNDMERAIEHFPNGPRAYDPFDFYAMACINKSITGCLLAAQALENEEKNNSDLQ